MQCQPPEEQIQVSVPPPILSMALRKLHDLSMALRSASINEVNADPAGCCKDKSLHISLAPQRRN